MCNVRDISRAVLGGMHSALTLWLADGLITATALAEEHLAGRVIGRIEELLDQHVIAQSPRLALKCAVLRAFREAAEVMQSRQILATLAPSSMLRAYTESEAHFDVTHAARENMSSAFVALELN